MPAAEATPAPAGGTAGALASTAPAGHPAGEQTTTLTLKTTVRSVAATVHTLPGGVVYGWNRLTGTTRWGGSTADVEFLGSVAYVDGNGPFTGLVTVTRPNGTTLAFSVTGTSTSTSAGASTTDSRFTGDVRILGGSGNWARSRGNGTFTGSRKAALGGAVRMTFRLAIVR